MSFGSACDTCGFAFSSRGVRGFFPDLRTVARPGQWRMLADVRRFYREARAVLARRDPNPGAAGRHGSTSSASVGPFRDHFLVPIASAVWSTAACRILEFPVAYLLRFLDNHGLIGFGNAPQWRVVRGGSRTYVERIVGTLPAGSMRTAPRCSMSGATRSA